MSSVIHYKFKSAKDYDTFSFDGAGVPVWELKNEIITAKKLGRGNDYELIISNAQNQQEYTDDNQVIQRNASVLVKRVPASSKYRARSVPEYKTPYSQQGSTLTSASKAVTPKTGREDEDARIKSMLQESSLHWDKNQEMPSQYQYSQQRRKRFPQRTIPVHEGYVCFRCGNKGHHINNCPTNSDTNYDRPRIKRTTGIPKTFLKSVTAEEKSAAKGGLMVTSEGGMVVAMPNDKEWLRVSGMTGKAHDIPEPLCCPKCNQLFRHPVQVSCCQRCYCEECVENELACPGCMQALAGVSLTASTELEGRCTEFASTGVDPGQRIAEDASNGNGGTTLNQ